MYDVDSVEHDLHFYTIIIVYFIIIIYLLTPDEEFVVVVESTCVALFLVFRSIGEHCSRSAAVGGITVSVLTQ